VSPRGRYLAAGLVAVGALAGPSALLPLAPNGSSDTTAEVAVTLRDEAIDESSGLVVRGDRLFTVNDSGDGPYVYEVDLRTGETVGVTTFADEDPVDVEALAPGRGEEIWVGDIGDNLRSRGSIRIHRLVPAEGGGRADATTYHLAYPDGPHDAEALLVHPRTDRVLVVTKRFGRGGQVHRAPRRLEPGRIHRLERIATVPGMITDGTFLPDGRRVLLRTYGGAAVYSYPGFELLQDFELPAQEQGEAVAVGDDGRVYLTTEGTLSDVLVLDLPDVEEPAAAAEEPTGAAEEPTGPAATPGEGEGGAGPGRPRGYALAAVVGSALVALLVRASRRRGRRMR
jgi:hypothetical protein